MSQQESPATTPDPELKPHETSTNEDVDVTQPAKASGTKNKERSISSLMAMVFNEEMLLEMILERAIVTGYNDNVLDTNELEVSMCRLVNKTWLHLVSKILRQSRLPLFKLVLNENNSINSSPLLQASHGGIKLLDQFMQAVTGSSRMETRIPSFGIKASANYFKEENYQSFTDCLLLCGSGLVELKITFPGDGGSMPFFFPTNLKLPLLKIFHVKLRGSAFQENEPRSSSLVVGNNYNVLYLIQSIWNASTELKHFKMPLTLEDNIIPSSFGLMTLPQTITKLNFGCEMSSKDLRILVKNPLPCLQELTLCTSPTPLEAQLIYRILENCCSTLEQFNVHSSQFLDNIRLPTYFTFPYMEKLKSVDVCTRYCELEDNVSALEENLPNLTSVILLDHTVSMFQKWVKKSKFLSVKSLIASLVSEDDSTDRWVSFNFGMLHKLNKSFPNLVCLNVSMSGTNIFGLRCVFKEMKQLKNLGVRLDATTEITNSDYWDALLLGFRLEVAPSLRVLNAYQKGLAIPSFTIPGLKALTELRALCLRDCSEYDPSAEFAAPLFSDAVFHFGFLKMPELHDLLFNGRFLTSPTMTKRWESTGRNITYDTS